jgi:hypothetical protein
MGFSVRGGSQNLAHRQLNYAEVALRKQFEMNGGRSGAFEVYGGIREKTVWETGNKSVSPGIGAKVRITF